MSTKSRTPTPAASQRRSIVRRVADAIRRDALESAEGALLGSEDDLIVRYAVSRPTLRQAAALVAQENLLVVKRGVGGGYFARRPDSQAVAHVAAVYLRSRKTRVEEIIAAVAPIRIELAKLAALSADETLKGRLKDFLAQEAQREQVTYGEFLRGEREFGKLMSALSGNHVIALFLQILYDFSASLPRDEDMFRNHPERVAEYRAKRNRLAEALLAGDEEIAVVAAKRCAQASAGWMLQDLKRRAPGERLIALPGFANEPPTQTPAPKRARAAKTVPEPEAEAPVRRRASRRSA